jgi:hypothetical protein
LRDRIAYVSIAPHVSRPRNGRPLATLFQLSWNGDNVSCVVYKRGDRLEMCLETGARVLLTERFAIQPRMLARVKTLKKSLKRRGWQEPAGRT